MPPSALVPRLQIVAAAVLFSTGGAAVKATSLSAWQVASFRSGLAALVLAVAFSRSTLRRPSPRILAVGLAYAVALGSYVLANKLTTAAATIFLVSTSLLWVLLLAPRWLGEPNRPRDLVLIAALAAGLAFIVGAPGAALATASDPALGNWIALGSGFAWALTVIGLRSLSPVARTGESAGAGSSSRQAVVWGNLFAFALALPLALPVGDLQPVDFGVVSYLGLIQIGLAYVLLLAGLRHIRALEASLLLILEPVLNPLWAWLLHSELPARTTLAGGAVIVTALAVHAWHAAQSSGEARGEP